MGVGRVVKEVTAPGAARAGGSALLLLVGWWAGALAAERSEALAAGRWAQALRARPGSTWPALPHPRALRRAEGVGQRRSVDLARHLWRWGHDAELEELAGVGPRTARAARALLGELPVGIDAGWALAEAPHRKGAASGAAPGG